MDNPLNHAWVVLGLERQGDIPCAVRERLRWPRGLIWLALALTAAALLFVAVGVVRFTGWLWAVPAIDLAVVVGGPRAINRRLLREVRAADFSICPECGYRLTGLPATHVCPSCGRSYSLATVRATWLNWFERTVRGWHAPE